MLGGLLTGRPTSMWWWRFVSLPRTHTNTRAPPTQVHCSYYALTGRAVHEHLVDLPAPVPTLHANTHALPTQVHGSYYALTWRAVHEHLVDLAAPVSPSQSRTQPNTHAPPLQVHGSYYALTGRAVHEHLVDLTGGVGFKIKLGAGEAGGRAAEDASLWADLQVGQLQNSNATTTSAAVLLYQTRAMLQSSRSQSLLSTGFAPSRCARSVTAPRNVANTRSLIPRPIPCLHSVHWLHNVLLRPVHRCTTQCC